MSQNKTQFDRILFRINNNPVTTSLVALGTLVIALSTFTDAAKNLVRLVASDSPVDVAGTWTTPVLTNPFAKNDAYRLTFQFEGQGSAIKGTIRKISTTKRYDISDGILGGKIEGNVVSFYKMGQSLVGQGTVTYKDFYSGAVVDDEMTISLSSDRPFGFQPQQFKAKRES